MNGSGVPVLSVRLNGDSLSFNQNHYSRTGGGVYKETWEINGANGVASFLFSPRDLVPAAPDIAHIPDTISLSSGLVVRLNNCVNIGTGILSISDGTLSTNNFYIKNGNNTIVITPSALANFVPNGNTGRLYLYFNNKKVFKIKNKDYQFNEIVNYVQDLWIKP